MSVMQTIPELVKDLQAHIADLEEELANCGAAVLYQSDALEELQAYIAKLESEAKQK